MKIHYFVLVVTVAVSVFFGCSEKPGSESAPQSETPGLSEQPGGASGEGKSLIDKAGESLTEAGDAVKEAAKETGEAVEQGAESVEKAASDAADVVESNVESIKENMEQSAIESTAPVVEQSQTKIIEVSPPVDAKPTEGTVIEEKVEAVEEASPVSP